LKIEGFPASSAHLQDSKVQDPPFKGCWGLYEAHSKKDLSSIYPKISFLIVHMQIFIIFNGLYE